MDPAKELQTLTNRVKTSTSHDALRSIQNDAGRLYKETESKLDKCNTNLKNKQKEIDEVELNINYLRYEIQTLENTIQQLERDTEELKKLAKQNEEAAVKADSEADESNRKAWSSVGSVATGLILAPVTFGITLAIVGDNIDMAKEAFTDRNSKRKIAVQQRQEAHRNIKKIEEEKKSIVKKQNEITEVTKRKDKIDNEMLLLKAELGELENIQSHLSCFLKLVTLKIDMCPDARVSKSSKTALHEDRITITERVYKEIDEIISDLERSLSICTRASKYSSSFLPEVLEKVKSFRETLQTQYEHILRKHEHKLDEKKTTELVEYLESLREDITGQHSNISENMVQHLEKLMEMHTANSQLYRELIGFAKEVKEKIFKIEELEQKAVRLDVEAKDYEKQAEKKDDEKVLKRLAGVASIGICGLGALLAAPTGGLSLALTAAAAPTAAITFFSAETCRREANSKREVAAMIRDEIAEIKQTLPNLHKKVQSSTEKSQAVTRSIRELNEDEAVIYGTIKPLENLGHVVNSILDVLQV